MAYSVEEHALGLPRRLRVVCIGAGATGLDVTYKIKKHLRNIDLQVYEKNESIGGTWFENRSVLIHEGTCSWTHQLTNTCSDTQDVLAIYQRTSIR